MVRSATDGIAARQEGLAALQTRIAAHLDAMRTSPLATSALYSIFIESLFGMPELKPKITELTDRGAMFLRRTCGTARRAARSARTLIAISSPSSFCAPYAA